MRINPWIVPPALVALGVVALVVQQQRIPTRADWKAATDAIRAELQPGDGVTFVPSWAGEGRLFLHGLPAFEIVDGEPPDLARYVRVWVIGAFGRDADELGQWSHAEQRRFGRLTLDRITVEGPRVTHDLRAELDRTTVRQGNATCDFWDGRAWYCGVRRDHAQVRDCLGRPAAQRFRDRRQDPRCGLPDWFDGAGRYGVSRGAQPVGRDARVIGGAARRCVWFTPPPGGRPGTIEWPMPATAGVVEVRYGFTDHVLTDHTPQAFAEVLTQPAILSVTRGATAIGEVTAEPTPGWKRAAFPLAGSGPLTLTVRSASDVNAHLCVDVTVREAG